MSAKRIPFSIESVVQQRQQLKKTIQRLIELAEHELLEAATGSGTDLADTHLKALFDEFSELFALKRLGGYFDDLTESSYHMQRPVEQLMADHRHLLDDLLSMRNELPHRPQKVRRLLHGWLVRFQELDRRETRLFQDIWNVDVGSID